MDEPIAEKKKRGRKPKEKPPTSKRKPTKNAEDAQKLRMKKKQRSRTTKNIACLKTIITSLH